MADIDPEEKPKCTFFKKSVKRPQQQRRKAGSDDEKGKTRSIYTESSYDRLLNVPKQLAVDRQNDSFVKRIGKKKCAVFGSLKQRIICSSPVQYLK